MKNNSSEALMVQHQMRYQAALRSERFTAEDLRVFGGAVKARNPSIGADETERSTRITEIVPNDVLRPFASGILRLSPSPFIRSGVRDDG